MALKRRDTYTAACQMSHLVKKVGKDKHATKILQDSLTAVKNWNEPYALLSCTSDIIGKLPEGTYLPQAVLDVLLDATLAIAPTDPVTAMEQLIPALKKVKPGTMHEYQVTDHMAHICAAPSPVLACELLALLIEADNIAYENENSEHLLHECMIALAETVAPYKPVLALDAYGTILDDLDDKSKARREDIAARIVALSEIVAPRKDDHDAAMEGLEQVLDSMPRSSAALQQAVLLRSKLTISRDTDPDYSGAPAMTPQEFSKLIGPNPL